jgi:aspartate aminotransferase
MKIAQRIADIPQSPHRKVVSIADRKKREGKTVYNFSQGQPGLPPDGEAVRTFVDKMLRQPFEVSRYVDARGLLQLREAVAEDLRNYGGMGIPPEQIIVTDGALEGLSLTLTCLAKPGDNVLLLEPCYSVYWDLLQLHELRAVTVSQKLDDSFQPNPEDIKKALDMDISAIILCSPDNPTGRIISEEAAKTITDAASEKSIPLLYDEAYKHITYEGKHLWIRPEGPLADNLVSLDSFSKDLAIPGFRLGYLYGPKGLVDQIAKLKALTSICSPTPSQYMALAYFEKGLKGHYLRDALATYRGRRDALYQSLRANLPLARVLKPDAGMYLFPDVSAYLKKMAISDVDFCLKLAEDAEVITIPGSISGPSGEGHLRMCFVGESEDKLDLGVKKMAEYLSRRA